MTIEEILSTYASKSQKLSQVLTNFGLHCVGCGAATYETLEAGVLGHGMEEEDLDELLDHLNQILAETAVDPTQVTLTESAAKKIKEIQKAEGIQKSGLRFGDRAGGCGGYEYTLEFSEKAEKDDAVFESHGVSIFVNKGMLNRLVGSEIDYVEGLMGGGFKISNPNVRGSCGCGNSQSY